MSLITRFDHVVIAARDLPQATQLYRDRLALDVQPGGRHTGRGTHNAIIRFGLDYVELLSLFNPDEARAAGKRRAALVDYLDTHETGLVGYCLAVRSLDEMAAHFRATGLEAMGPYEMERKRPDGHTLKWRLLVPEGMSWRRPWPFFIQWEIPDTKRLQLEAPGNHTLGVVRISGVTVAVRDIDAAKHLYGHHFDLPLDASQSSANRARYRLPDGFCIDLFAPAASGDSVQQAISVEGEGLHTVTFAVDDVDAARAQLSNAGVELTPARGVENGWLIPADQGAGFPLVIEPAG